LHPIVSTPSLPFEPYYRDESVTIYNGDCRKLLPWLGKFDLLLTDPPYGIDYKPEGGGKVAKRFTNKDRVVGDDKPFDPRGWLLDCADSFCIWGGSNFANTLPPSRGWLVWEKKDGIYYENAFSDCEIAWTKQRCTDKDLHPPMDWIPQSQ
jgi:site-specific DNA-methyltransferase (adenine-specific)